MKISILGVKWDKYQCFRGGANNGIDLIREQLLSDTTELSIFSSQRGESYDMYDTEVQDLGDVEPKESSEIVELVKERAEKAEGLLVTLGGSHAISLGPVKVVKPENFVVLDAHSDLYPKDFHEGEWMKHPPNTLSQENVTWCVHKEGVKIHLIGQRVFGPRELEFMKINNITVSNVEKLKAITGSVYLSIDFDCLDPSVFLAVGNHEPNGMSFKQVIETVRVVADKVVAVDFVEFTPFLDEGVGKELNRIYARLASKLIWQVLAEIKRAKDKSHP